MTGAEHIVDVIMLLKLVVDAMGGTCNQLVGWLKHVKFFFFLQTEKVLLLLATVKVQCMVQERLRTLRASLGSSKLPSPQEGSATQAYPKPTPASHPTHASKALPRRKSGLSPASRSPHPGALAVTAYNPPARAEGNAAEDPPRAATPCPEAAGTQSEGRLLECEAVQGLCQLLEHHVTVLEQSQEPIGSLLQPNPTEAGE